MNAPVQDPWTGIDLGDPQAVLTQALALFGDRLAIANSFSAEDILLVDFAWRIWPDVRVFSLDTGRLPEESYEAADALRRRGVNIEWQTPKASALKVLVEQEGPFGFRRSLEARHRCCGVRKVEPLKQILGGLDAWVTGQRREQGVTRQALQVLEPTEAGPLKINPLAAWSFDEVWAEGQRAGLPVHGLYAQGYRSIGCAPCTRATRAGEDERAGRWWWERAEHKECGIHDRLHPHATSNGDSHE